MQWSRLTLCEYHNQPCVLSCYQSGYLHLYPTWENPKPRFWHFEHWFLKVLKIFENTLLYITVASFGSGGGGEGKVFISASGAVGEGCDPTVIPTLQTAASFVETICTWKPWWSNPRHRLTPVARYFTDLSLPHPPKTPVRQTDK
jgi:hypothetical protein